MKATIQYISALDELKEATTSNKIKWNRNGTECYNYKMINEDLEDLIIIFTKRDKDFTLTIEKKDFESTQQILNLDTTTTDSELRDTLSNLFDTVEYQVDINNLEGLNKFVDLVKNSDDQHSILD